MKEKRYQHIVKEGRVRVNKMVMVKTKKMANRIFRELKIKVERKICRTRDYSTVGSKSYMFSFMYSKSPSIVVSWIGSVDELIDAKWKITEIKEHKGFLCDKMYRIEINGVE